MPTCAINCSIISQQLDLDPGHARLLEPRTNEFEFELDVDNNETVGFQIGDFIHAGNTYTVTVVATRNGTTQTWTRNSGVCTSPTENGVIQIDIDVTATAPGVSTLTKGGIIRILPKAKPD